MKEAVVGWGVICQVRKLGVGGGVLVGQGLLARFVLALTADC